MAEKFEFEVTLSNGRARLTVDSIPICQEDVLAAVREYRERHAPAPEAKPTPGFMGQGIRIFGFTEKEGEQWYTIDTLYLCDDATHPYAPWRKVTPAEMQAALRLVELVDRMHKAALSDGCNAWHVAACGELRNSGERVPRTPTEALEAAAAKGRI